MRNKIKTIAIQVDDPNFIEQYEQRIKESGLSLKNYLIGLIKSDIGLNQTQNNVSVQDENIQTNKPEQMENPIEPEQMNNPDPQQNSNNVSENIDDITNSIQNSNENTEDISNGITAEISDGNQELSNQSEPQQNSDEISDGINDNDITNDIADDITNDETADNPIENQNYSEEPEPQQIKPDTPEEMMNFFAKIPKEQRDVLDTHKKETAEPVGNVISRIIDKFLDCTDKLPEGFEETYQRYTDNIKSCDTTCSAKIPIKVNQELTDYLNSFGGSRNALMATLVDLEFKGQEMTHTEDENQGMKMT